MGKRAPKFLNPLHGPEVEEISGGGRRIRGFGEDKRAGGDAGEGIEMDEAYCCDCGGGMATTGRGEVSLESTVGGQEYLAAAGPMDCAAAATEGVVIIAGGGGGGREEVGCAGFRGLGNILLGSNFKLPTKGSNESKPSPDMFD